MKKDMGLLKQQRQYGTVRNNSHYLNGNLIINEDQTIGRVKCNHGLVVNMSVHKKGLSAEIAPPIILLKNV